MSRALKQSGIGGAFLVNTSFMTDVSEDPIVEAKIGVFPLIRNIDQAQEYLDEIIGLLGDEVDSGGLEEDDSPWDIGDIKDIFYYDNDRIMRKDLSVVCHSHPLIKDMIINGDFSIKWWTDVSKGIVPEVESSHASDIQWLLGIEGHINNDQNLDDSFVV